MLFRSLSGQRIQSLADARDAARRIQELGARAVVITGGHGLDAYEYEGSGLRAEGSSIEIVDLLVDGDAVYEFRTPRIDTRNTHGTGCTFASAVAAHLARGRTLPEAAERAQHYVAGAIAHALAIGHGHGPLDHFWQTRSPVL